MTPGPQSPCGEASPRDERNLLCTILFLDLVGYSARPGDEQARIKARLNALLARVLHHISPRSRLAIDTGDGAALCFLGDPQDALDAAMLLRDLLAQRHCGALPARIGLHTGPVRVVGDINGHVNVVGDGINVAQRIMDCARPHQVLASRAYFDILRRMGDGTARLFRYAGVHRDKHGRLHELHLVQGHPAGVARTLRESSPEYLTEPPQPALSASAVHALEQTLMRYIGPVAPLLVQQALAGQPAPEALVQGLAGHVAAGPAREAFRQEALRLMEAGDGPALRQPAAPPRR